MFANTLLLAGGRMLGVKTFNLFDLLVRWLGCLLLGLITAVIVLGIPIGFMMLFKMLFKKKTLV